MDRFIYENQGSSRFLVYQLREEEELDQMALGMMSQNKIPHLLPVSYTQIDSKRYLRYSGLSLSTLKSLMGGIVTKERLLSILSSICEGILSSEEYLLEGNAFVLDADYVYVDSASGKTSLVYLPILNQDRKNQYRVFLKSIITDIISDPSEDGSHIPKLLFYLNTAENFSLAEFSRQIRQLKVELSKEKVKSKEKIKSEQIRKTVSGTDRNRQELPREKKTESQKEEKIKESVGPIPEKKQQGEERRQEIDKKERSPKKGKHEETGYSFAIPGQSQEGRSDGLPASSPEEGQNEEKMSMMYLLRNFSGENLKKYKNQKPEKQTGEKTKEKNKKQRAEGGKAPKKKKASLILVSLESGYPGSFTVNKDIFNIGRREGNDVVLSGMKRISRDHCSIVKEKGLFYVIDRNSTYGTIVDGIKCIPREKSGALHENSVIELPDLRFRVEFR